MGRGGQHGPAMKTMPILILMVFLAAAPDLQASGLDAIRTNLEFQVGGKWEVDSHEGGWGFPYLYSKELPATLDKGTYVAFCGCASEDVDGDLPGPILHSRQQQGLRGHYLRAERTPGLAEHCEGAGADSAERPVTGRGHESQTVKRGSEVAGR